MVSWTDAFCCWTLFAAALFAAPTLFLLQAEENLKLLSNMAYCIFMDDLRFEWDLKKLPQMRQNTESHLVKQSPCFRMIMRW